MLPDSLLVDMVPKVITALRLTTELLWVISWERGSKTLRPSRHTLLFSPYDRDKSKMKHSPWWIGNWKIIMTLLIYQNIRHIKCIMRKLDFFFFFLLFYDMLYLSQQMCGFHYRPWLRCPLLRSLTRALLWLGFWFQQSELQTDYRKRKSSVIAQHVFRLCTFLAVAVDTEIKETFWKSI